MNPEELTLVRQLSHRARTLSRQGEYHSAGFLYSSIGHLGDSVEAPIRSKAHLNAAKEYIAAANACDESQRSHFVNLAQQALEHQDSVDATPQKNATALGLYAQVCILEHHFDSAIDYLDAARRTIETGHHNEKAINNMYAALKKRTPCFIPFEQEYLM